jgi:O-antigen ligase/Flp pilus assembly protein TadD
MSAKRRRKGSAADPDSSKRSRLTGGGAKGPTARPRELVGEFALRAGVFAGTCGVAATFWFGLRNPFGPPKALVLALAAAFSLAGLALVPGALSALARGIRSSRIAWALSALCALAALATVTAIDPRQALLGGYPDYRGLVSVLAYAAVGAGAVALWSREGGARWIGRSATLCLLWVGAIGVIQRVGFFPTGVRGDFGAAWRVSSTLGNSSNLGVFLVALMPLVVWVALKDTRREWRVTAWIACAAGALSLVWTLSRGAWLAAIAVALVGAVTYAWTRRKRWNSGALAQRRVVWIAGAAVVALAVAVAFTPTFVARASKLFDSGSTTGAWRLSTWRSAAEMTLARPFLGFGPNQFRYAYPQFQAPGQIDGRTGYPVVESAHNLFADTGTSFGLLGLVALLVAGAFSARVAYRSLAGVPEGGGSSDSRSAEREVPAFALALGLLGGAVALQFHYVTMDTGPLLALGLAGLVVREADVGRDTGSAQGAESPAGLRSATWAAAAMAMLYLGVAVGVGGLLGADRALARAETMVRAGAPWKTVSAQLAQAEALARWEAQVVRARGTLATAVVAKRFDSVAAIDGIRALDAASAMTPADAVLAAERGNLLLAAGAAAKNRELLGRAIDAFSEAEKMDPNTGIAMAGRASALLALHRLDEAIALFQRALKLSPRYSQGWRNLAIAYRNAGRDREAKNADWRAKHWDR